jgi:hypothetical protein
MAFGNDTPESVVSELTNTLVEANPRTAPAASEALRAIGNKHVLSCLAQAAKQQSSKRDWALATLGRLPPELVREYLKGDQLLGLLEPMLLVGRGASWLATDDAVASLTLLGKQYLFELTSTQNST